MTQIPAAGFKVPHGIITTVSISGIGGSAGRRSWRPPVPH